MVVGEGVEVVGVGGGVVVGAALCWPFSQKGGIDERGRGEPHRDFLRRQNEAG